MNQQNAQYKSEAVNAIEASKEQSQSISSSPTAAQLDGHKVELVKMAVARKLRDFEPEMRLERFCD